jgi:hypothetical protein
MAATASHGVSFIVRSTKVLALAAGACIPILASAGPNPVSNLRMSYPYPQNNYSFQDGRTIHDVIAGTLPPELLNAGDPEDLGPAQFCFDSVNPPSEEVMAQINRIYGLQPYGSRYFAVQRWTGVAGSPISLTWSFVPDGVLLPGLSGADAASTLFSTMDTRFSSAGGRAVWIAQFQASFDRWQAISGINYTRVRSGTNEWDDGAAWGNARSATRGDVRIGMRTLDGVNGVLAFNQFPDNGDMVIDSSEGWQASGNNFRFLRNVIMHEHGHGLGFAHSCPIANTKLMEPFLSTAFDGPQQDDIRAVQEFYGDVNEPNDSTTSFTALGNLAAGSTTNLGAVPSPTPANSAILSIDASSDSDYYQFTLDAPRLVNITVTPVGSSYLTLPQNQNGSCPTTGTNENSLAAANLVFDLRNNLNSILRTVNANGAGLAETTTGMLLSPTGNFFLRVYASGGLSSTQLYRISITVQNANLAPSASDGTFGDKVRVTWPSTITDGTGYQIVRSTTNSTSTGTTLATVAGDVFTYDDTTAVPGTTYFYFIRAQQPGSVGYRFMTATGDAGFRTVSTQAPVANAGPNQTVSDNDRSGDEVVTLDASGSTDADGTIVSYVWTEGANQLATGINPNITLPVGPHTLTLTVTDNSALTATDTVQINVDPFCFADYNQDGGVDGTDIAAFFADWSAGDTLADANADGGVDGADIEAFFLVWAAGGC